MVIMHPLYIYLSKCKHTQNNHWHQICQNCILNGHEPFNTSPTRMLPLWKWFGCYFPNIWLNFRFGWEIKSTVWHTDKMKLSTKCMEMQIKLHTAQIRSTLKSPLTHIFQKEDVTFSWTKKFNRTECIRRRQLYYLGDERHWEKNGFSFRFVQHIPLSSDVLPLKLGLFGISEFSSVKEIYVVTQIVRLFTVIISDHISLADW